MGDSDDRKAYWEARLRSQYTLGGVGYLGLGDAFNRWSYRVRSRTLQRILRSLKLPRGAPVLDVGSGTGFMIEMWHKAGFTNVQGCDITSVAVGGLTQRFPSSRFLEVDISAGHVPYSTEFDAVSANDILYHIVDDAAYQRALSNLFAALRPGGYFVFTENFLHGPTRRAEHQVSRSLTEIEAMLRQAGFVTIVRRPVFVLMNNPIDSNSRLLRFWWQNLVRILRRAPRSAGAVGTLLYGPELALVRAMRDGPSTEVMVCRRPTTSA